MFSPTGLARTGVRHLAARLSALALVALPALFLAAGPAAAFTDAEKKELGGIIREYLIQNPEVLQEAISVLESRQMVADATQRSKAVAELKPLLLASPRGIVAGNPQGDVTLVEFFDYNCGFCKRALAETIALVQADSRIRLVLKDFPVLTQGSVEAAQVAVALKMQVQGAKYLEFHTRLLGGRGQADRARALEVAREIGADMPRLERDMGSAQVRATLAENARLAEQLRINGTPSYVVGDEVVVGAVGADKLRENIVRARATCARQVGVC